MPLDVLAEVLWNQPLSADYNVIALAAPQIAERTAPGQFVMVRTRDALDPLLRRPFSVFECLRDGVGRPTGITLLNKRVGVGTRLLYRAAAGERLACLGPLGRPFTVIDPPGEAWLVAGGVGLAPFATLAEALVARGTTTRLFYGARRGDELYRSDLFERLGVGLQCATEDGSVGARGFVTVPLARALAARGGGHGVQVYACGPTPMMREVAAVCARAGAPCEVSLEQVMGCGLGGCYSCVVRVRDPGGAAHFVRSCVHGPVFDAGRLVWESGEG
jgi:dihydroorotate dehydrogenase electron transfer subunit